MGDDPIRLNLDEVRALWESGECEMKRKKFERGGVMDDNVAAQCRRYPDLAERLAEFWMYSVTTERDVPDDIREAVAWAWDQIVRARDELERLRVGHIITEAWAWDQIVRARDKLERLRAGYIITDDEIDAAWKHTDSPDDHEVGAALSVLAEFGIVACPNPECDKGIVTEAEQGMDGDVWPVPAPCEICSGFTGHGWVKQ